jgi:hypothetical protein
MSANNRISAVVALAVVVTLWRGQSQDERLRVRAIDIVNGTGDVVMTLEGDELGAYVRMRAAPSEAQRNEPIKWGVELSASELTHSSLVLSGTKSHGERSRVAIGIYGEPQTPFMTFVDHKGVDRLTMRSMSNTPPTLCIRDPEGKVILSSDDSH